MCMAHQSTWNFLDLTTLHTHMHTYIYMECYSWCSYYKLLPPVTILKGLVRFNETSICMHHVHDTWNFLDLTTLHTIHAYIYMAWCTWCSSCKVFTVSQSWKLWFVSMIHFICVHHVHDGYILHQSTWNFLDWTTLHTCIHAYMHTRIWHDPHAKYLLCHNLGRFGTPHYTYMHACIHT
jgi:hypothetical protein